MTGKMNSTSTNVGGWPATEARELANGEYFNYLPSDLQKVIIDTNVISGHGSTVGETNFTSTDKLYLLSAHEVYGDGTSNPISTYDTAWNNTRQLDYYKAKNVTADGHWSSAIKWYNINEMAYWWWLRGANSNSNNYFSIVDSIGNRGNTTAGYAYGFAPAFRIG